MTVTATGPMLGRRVLGRNFLRFFFIVRSLFFLPPLVCYSDIFFF